jgi:hypothetical protein
LPSVMVTVLSAKRRDRAGLLRVFVAYIAGSLRGEGCVSSEGYTIGLV